MINRLVDGLMGGGLLFIIGYFSYIKINNYKMKKQLFLMELKDEKTLVKKEAYDTPLDELVDESNKSIRARIRGDKD